MDLFNGQSCRNWWRVMIKRWLTVYGLRDSQSCRHCGRNQSIVWTVENAVWNLLPRKYRDSCLCLECFAMFVPSVKLSDFTLKPFGETTMRDAIKFVPGRQYKLVTHDKHGNIQSKNEWILARCREVNNKLRLVDDDGDDWSEWLFNPEDVRKVPLSENNEAMNAVQTLQKCGYSVDDIREAMHVLMERKSQKTLTEGNDTNAGLAKGF